MMPSASTPRTTSNAIAFQADRARGIRLHADGRRAALRTADDVLALHHSLVAQFGDDAADVLYRCGFEWGLTEMVALAGRWRVELGQASDPWQMDAKFVLDSWWAPLTAAGWGACTFDTSKQARKIILAEVRGSLVAAALAGAEEPVCHLYAGLLAGGVSFYERAERHAVELHCAAIGAASCRFVIGPGTDIDAAETWRQQGVSAQEISQRLR